MTGFRDEQLARLAASGWSRCGSVARAVADAGLPAVTAGYLEEAFSDDRWRAAERATSALREHFRDARFADEATWGIVLVPAAEALDTRRPVAPEVRQDQLGAATPDVFDERLGPGRLGPPSAGPWTMVATVTGAYGISLGSHERIVAAPASAFTVEGIDTRALMLRRIWGARVLQGGDDLPDCEANERWTFTLLPGEGLTDGCAESGTVLKGKVRFRLGKPDRGIGSARVAPAIAVA